jgi:hypothetical protein
MLEALEVANQKTDKQSMGAKVGPKDGQNEEVVAEPRAREMVTECLLSSGWGRRHSVPKSGTDVYRLENWNDTPRYVPCSISSDRRVSTDYKRRFKAAFEAYKEDQMPVVKDEVCPLPPPFCSPAKYPRGYVTLSPLDELYYIPSTPQPGQ